jgi:hypothetical protein
VPVEFVHTPEAYQSLPAAARTVLRGSSRDAARVDAPPKRYVMVPRDLRHSKATGGGGLIVKRLPAGTGDAAAAAAAAREQTMQAGGDGGPTVEQTERLRRTALFHRCILNHITEQLMTAQLKEMAAMGQAMQVCVEGGGGRGGSTASLNT